MKAIQRLRRNRKGFTLVEIIVVLVILAILAAFTIPAMLGFVTDAQKKAHIAEAREVYVAATAANAEFRPADGDYDNTKTDDFSNKINSYVSGDLTGAWTATVAGGKVTKITYTIDSTTYTLTPGGEVTYS